MACAWSTWSSMYDAAVHQRPRSRAPREKTKWRSRTLGRMGRETTLRNSRP